MSTIYLNCAIKYRAYLYTYRVYIKGGNTKEGVDLMSFLKRSFETIVIFEDY